MTFKSELFSEMCCEECSGIIHYHFKCPMCGDDYAGTSIYSELDDPEFSCEECGSEFKILDEELPVWGAEMTIEFIP